LVLIYDPYAKMICCQNYISLRVKDSSLKWDLRMFYTAYMPYFRAQMNCVPGMVTICFYPIYTTDEYRELPYMVEKVANINQLSC
jgi:cytochrome c oxidase subunit 2